MVHLLEKYNEAAVNDDRVLNTAEKRLCRAYYQTKNERESLLGQASKYITVMIKNEKYIPGFDPRYEKDVAALYSRAQELDARAEDLIKRIDKISGRFQTDIMGLNEEKRKIEDRIKQISPILVDEQAKLLEQHSALSRDIDEYLSILRDI